MRQGLTYHYVERKRKSKKLDPFPSDNRFKRIVDRMIFVVIFIGPIMTLPQLWNIWVLRTVEGLSVLSWGTYVFTSSFWFFYAFLHKEKPLIVSACLWVALEVMIVVGILMFR